MAEPAVQDLVAPEDPTQAPGQLGLVEAFVNTVTYDGEATPDEQFADAQALDDWLRTHGLLDDDEPVAAADVPRVIAFREALRELLHAHHDGMEPDAAALEVLGEAARRAPLAISLDGTDHATLGAAGTGVDRAVGELLAIIHHAMHDGTWERLKACRNDGCRWAFYDRSRNRSGRWCDMAVCGNRAKVRAFRERQDT